MNRTVPFLRVLSIVLIAVFLLSLVPVLYAARYNLPDSDDLLFNGGTTFEQRHSLKEALSTAASTAKSVYEVYHGRYAASFWGAFFLYFLNLGNYWIVPYLMLAFFLAGVLYFNRVVLVDALRGDNALWLSLTVLMLLCYMQFLPSAAEGFFWLSGAVNYTFEAALVLMMLGLLLRMYLWPEQKKRGVVRGILALVLSGTAAGLGYSVSLAAMGLLMGFIALAVVKKRRDCLLWGALTLLLFLIGTVVQVTAPGLAKRAAFEAAYYGLTHVPNAPRAVAESFVYAAGCLIARLDPSMLLFIALTGLSLAPYLKKSGFAFRLPGLVSAGSFCLFATVFTFSLYAQGNIGPLRQRNMVYLVEFWFWGVNTAYWTGWLLRRGEAAPALSAWKESWKTGVALLRHRKLPVLCLCALLLTATAFARDVNATTSVAALRETLSGSAQRRYETRLAEIAAGLGDDPGERELSRIFYY